MARNDGIDRTFARNQDLPTLDDVAKVQEHNEREKDSYSNQDPAACLVMKNKRNDSCPGSQVSRIPVSAAYRRRKISQDHRIYAIAEFRRVLQKF